MSQFLNSRENAVTEAIDGMLVASAGALSRLDGYPHIRVVLRSDWDKSKVAIVSGGGTSPCRLRRTRHADSRRLW
jgi:dihydroxyacetone kinase